MGILLAALSHQPGDNYRIAASADRDTLVRLENIDSRDNSNIVDPAIAASSNPAQRAAAPVRMAGAYTSKLLTVWRILHLEIDGMLGGGTLLPGAACGEFRTILGSGNAVTGLSTVENLNPPLTTAP